MPKYQAVLFDLDGTLVDTAPDLGFALNSLLTQEGHAPLEHALIRPVASNGSAGLLGLGFGIDANDPSFKSLQQRFVAIYQDNLTRESDVFPDMKPVLTELGSKGIAWGIVTNKPAFLTDPLTEQLGLDQTAGCIISGDTTPYSKPHPAPLLHACDLLNYAPEDCLYVGDAERDIAAAKAANMRSLAASYGYITDDDDVSLWQADGIISSPAEILSWL